VTLGFCKRTESSSEDKLKSPSNSAISPLSMYLKLNFSYVAHYKILLTMKG
jgi:hypothetical protein